MINANYTEIRNMENIPRNAWEKPPTRIIELTDREQAIIEDMRNRGIQFDWLSVAETLIYLRNINPLRSGDVLQ